MSFSKRGRGIGLAGRSLGSGLRVVGGWCVGGSAAHRQACVRTLHLGVVLAFDHLPIYLRHAKERGQEWDVRVSVRERVALYGRPD